ncbi:MAG: hypothetical protein AB1716_08130 [Planctomycetota bacterium]
MTCPVPDQWELLSLGLVAEPAAAALVAHARGCDACRAACARARRDHAVLLRAYEALDADHDRQRDALLAALPPAVPAAEPWLDGSLALPTWAGLRQRAGDLKMRLGMTTRIYRAGLVLLPAACLVAALVLFLTASPKVAFAQVLERIRSARTMVCELHWRSTHESGDALESAPLPPREGVSRLAMYADGPTRAWLIESDTPSPTRELWLNDRKYTTGDGKTSVIRLEGDSATTPFVETPDQWLGRLLALTEKPDRELGSVEIGGRKAVGFEVAAWRLGFGSRPADGAPADGHFRLWVDVATKLPLRMHLAHRTPGVLAGAGRLEQTWDNMQWDVPLDPQRFTPPVLTSADAADELTVAAPTEAALIAGLRAYAEQTAAIRALLAATAQRKGVSESDAELQPLRRATFAAHGYPERLDAQWLSLTVAGRVAALLTADRVQAGEFPGTDEQRTAWQSESARRQKKALGAVLPVALFYRNLLLEGREPEYFGTQVEPGDASGVLLRWKQADGRLRVIYGDLRAEALPQDR